MLVEVVVCCVCGVCGVCFMISCGSVDIVVIFDWGVDMVVVL